MNPIPTAADWDADPIGASAAASALAAKTGADTDSQTVAIALGIAAQVLQAALPLAATALGGSGGALAAAGINVLIASLSAQHATAIAALTPAQQALVTLAIQTGATAVAAKVKS